MEATLTQSSLGKFYFELVVIENENRLEICLISSAGKTRKKIASYAQIPRNLLDSAGEDFICLAGA